MCVCVCTCVCARTRACVCVQVNNLDVIFFGKNVVPLTLLLNTRSQFKYFGRKKRLLNIYIVRQTRVSFN